MSNTHFLRQQRLRRVQLDLLLMEVFGVRYLPNDVACRIAARREREAAFMGGIQKAIVRRERANAQWALVGVS